MTKEQFALLVHWAEVGLTWDKDQATPRESYESQHGWREAENVIKSAKAHKWTEPMEVGVK